MKLTYLYHSGFLLETEYEYLVFDFFLDGECDGVTPAVRSGIIPQFDSCQTDRFLKARCLNWCVSEPREQSGGGVVSHLLTDIAPSKPIYFLCTHPHPDHYNSVLKELPLEFAHVQVIVAKDFYRTLRQDMSGTENYFHVVKPNQSFTNDENTFKVNFFDSTDSGVSFAITFKNGRTLYFAGDNNLWLFPICTDDEKSEIRFLYQRILNQISNIYPNGVDVAILPFDPRLKDITALGADIFLEKVGARAVVQMHTWERPDLALKACQRKKRFKQIINLKHQDNITKLLEKSNVPLALFSPNFSGESIIF